MIQSVLFTLKKCRRGDKAYFIEAGRKRTNNKIATIKKSICQVVNERVMKKKERVNASCVHPVDFLL
jgi:hypothetical protein